MGNQAELDARAALWRNSGDTGLSSKALCSYMLTGTAASKDDYPRDAIDLGRCLRLLALFPEWAGRIKEMDQFGVYWTALVARWDELAKTLSDEVGIHFEKGERANRTYALMKSILDPIEDADPRIIKLGKGVKMTIG